jgi:hypothetical protein
MSRRIGSALNVKQLATPSETPAAGESFIYPKTDGKWYTKTPGGTELRVTGGQVYSVASQAAMLALAAQRGDMAVRTDVSKTYALATDSPGTLADWKEVLATSAGGAALANVQTSPPSSPATGQVWLDTDETQAGWNGALVITLGPVDAVPAGLPAGSVIVRRSS